MKKMIKFKDIKPGDCFTSHDDLHSYVAWICLSIHKTGLRVLRIQTRAAPEYQFLRSNRYRNNQFFKLNLFKLSGFSFVTETKA
jgi:hypothetical protein